MKEWTEKIKRIFKSEKIILLLFSIYVITTNLEYSVINTYPVYTLVAKIIRYAIYVYTIIKTILKIIEMKKINARFLAIIIFSLLVMIISKEKSWVTILIMILLIKDMNFEKIVKYCFYCNLVMYVIIIMGSIFKIIPNWTYSREFSIRYSMGYSYPTLTSTYLFILLLMRFYMKKGKKESWEIMLELLLASLVFYLTDSKTGFILSIIIILAETIIIVFKLPKNKERTRNSVSKICITIMPIIVVCFTFFLVIQYSNKTVIGIKADRIMSERLKYTEKAINDYGIPLFGKQIKWQGWGGYRYVELENFEYNFVDIAYFKMIFDKGIIFLIIYLALYSLYMKKIYDKKNFVLIFVNIIILIWGMIEPNILELGKNPFIVLMIIELIGDDVKIDSFIKKFKKEPMNNNQS